MYRTIDLMMMIYIYIYIYVDGLCVVRVVKAYDEVLLTTDQMTIVAKVDLSQHHFQSHHIPTSSLNTLNTI